MTIKQQGGIFGRNPTFNDVTIDGALNADGSVTVSNDLDVPVVFHNSTGEILITGGNAASNDYTQTTLLRLRATSINPNAPTHNDASSVAEIRLNHTDLAGSASSGNISFLTNPSNNANPATERLNIAANGNVTVSTGNLVIGTSGKGIDFSATSGTGTSELFDDYEEGTWTPTYVPASGSFGSITYDTVVTGGRYTKVGNLVHIQGGIRTDAITVGTASGGIRLGGLPFAAIASGTGHDGWSTLTIGQASAFAGDVPSAGSVVESQSYFELQYRSAANGATIDLAVADLGTGANANLMRFSATYIAG